MDKITETSGVPNTEFHWQYKMKYPYVGYAAYSFVMLLPLWVIADAETSRDFVLGGISVCITILWSYVLMREIRGINAHVKLTGSAICHWTDPRKPYTANNFFAKWTNRHEQSISKRNQVIIPNETIQAIFIPRSRDRIIIRRVQGRRSIIELNYCQSKETREALLEAILYYYKPVISQE